MSEMWMGWQGEMPLVDEEGTVRVVYAPDAGQARWLLGAYGTDIEVTRLEVDEEGAHAREDDLE